MSANRTASGATKKLPNEKSTVKRVLTKTEKAWLAARKKRSELLKKIHLAELKTWTMQRRTNKQLRWVSPENLFNQTNNDS